MQLSELTYFDFVCLVASYVCITDSNVPRVDTKALARGYTEEQLAQASGWIAKKFNPVVACGLRFVKPFDHLKFEPFSFVLTLFDNYERGCLPFPGSVSEQPAVIMEIFSVLRQLRHEQELKIRETSKPKDMVRKKR